MNPHIGILASDLSPTHGWGVYSLGVIHALRRAGVALTIVTAEDSPHPPDLAITTLLPSVNPMRRTLLPRQAMLAPRVRALLRDCTHIHALVEPYAPLGAWVAGARPFVLTAHGTYARMPARRFPIGALYRSAFRRAQIVAVSAHTAGVVRDLLPDSTPIVIPNGIDTERYLALERQPAPAPTLLFVGGVKRRKGVLELIEAFASVRETLPDARLHIVGSLTLEPGYVEALRSAITRLNLGDAVTLHGRLDDTALPPLYREAWAFALPAQTTDGAFEGFGLALLEASAAGLPVISTRGGGTEDAVQEGETGLLVAQGDGAALARCLLRVLTDDALATRLGAAGRTHAAAQTWDAVARRLMGVYNSNQTDITQ
jgi:glycosyltransferase involved in cell wall biosynthesis